MVCIINAAAAVLTKLCSGRCMCSIGSQPGSLKPRSLSIPKYRVSLSRPGRRRTCNVPKNGQAKERENVGSEIRDSDGAALIARYLAAAAAAKSQESAAAAESSEIAIMASVRV